VIGGLPGRELVRQQSPGATASNDVEDGVQDLARQMKPGSPDTPGRRQERLQTSELSVGEVGQVGAPRWQTPAILLPQTDPRPGFQTGFSYQRRAGVKLVSSAPATADARSWQAVGVRGGIRDV
jgi:hypothetical protein